MAHTPNPSRRSWVGPPTPFLTPRPERRELRWAEAGSHSSVRRSGVGACSINGSNDRDREANVQVVLRCRSQMHISMVSLMRFYDWCMVRPLSVEEQKANVQSAVSCNDTKREVTVLNSLFKQADKTFTFDTVFGPKSQQRAIYDHAVAPIVDDVLEGYNCTVFAFGQTGTGKTYTMEGEMMQQVGELPTSAGVMPRAVRHIFDILEAQKADYSMKVTFLELYNEEITDLLASEDQSRFLEDRHKRPTLSLMEDGKGGSVIRGLEEIVVYSPGEIYSLLQHGSTRRRTADTALNMQSSRSHSVFSIYIHVKVTTTGNRELIKCGRLNLVDLAGSESIARSGAKEVRAREAGELNKSLLTLGRVITALVEDSVHVPYRANMSLKEKDFIISNLLHAENVILERAKVLCGTVETASGDIADLQNKLGRQSKTEVENKGLLFNFRSQLDQSLGLLRNTVVRSICEQRQFLESMTGQMNSYFSAKSESANHLKRRIAKAKDMHTSGVQCMNELVNTLRQRSITDSEQMKLNISSQAIAVDNFLAVMVSEAEQVLTEVLRSTSELKELLAFSAEQQELGLQKSLTSAQAMSKTSIDFFNDISTHASRLMKLMKQSQRGCSSRLAEFEKGFEEAAIREEQAALDKIAGILAGLTARKTTMVSEYVGQLNERYSEEQEHLALEMSSLQQVSDNGKKEAASCAEKLKNQILEDMSSHANTKDKMGDVLQQCLKGSHHSVSYWSHTQSCLEHLNKSSVLEANDFIQERRNENESIIQEIQLRSSHNDAGFHAITSDILTTSENSHLVDHETRERMETLSTSFSNHLGLLTEKHNQGTESIRTFASNCIEKDYSVNSPVRHRPRELLAGAYSFESIEELRASMPDLVAKFKSKDKLDEVDKGKSSSDQTTRAPRSPLTPVNH
ncbi:kinesin-like protein KIN-5B isoform X2 [Triticum aestivum]|uniref:kinesin-like protein KIN-5B isoform X2 n=1 Tax=Triticum aestivum TaxID=4565 RepID=UPI001D0224BD|nr:kinesin-like protein KIN-5B isoform X2 [Triticum aestivum]